MIEKRLKAVRSPFYSQRLKEEDLTKKTVVEKDGRLNRQVMAKLLGSTERENKATFFISIKLRRMRRNREKSFGKQIKPDV
jgi:hypothetical protein